MTSETSYDACTPNGTETGPRNFGLGRLCCKRGTMKPHARRAIRAASEEDGVYLWSADAGAAGVAGGAEPVVLGRPRGAAPDARVRGAVHSVGQHLLREQAVIGHNCGSEVLRHALHHLQHPRQLLVTVLRNHLCSRLNSYASASSHAARILLPFRAAQPPCESSQTLNVR
eukprot:CAMPEP_0206150748 /NCGR_PEP_ID=MMETSP1473-20131121/38460_1 /ASSEMBLY_ACC=CAM_ASM_001109 /TAXON_ID=1461547 /ORGANISM="Stichococcus sp, Strain RCC1054" /LENGTH=170 /DNA_ID=CAMNT_0053548263 /DNA_START=201 /DNA_END=713 /DNA_ORIENTATION=-